MFHRIDCVLPLSDYRLCIRFAEGVSKEYDVKPLFDKWPAFQELKAENTFNNVRIDPGGYAVIWSDNLDLSCDELFENGKSISGETISASKG